jgi:hypothetical protein
MDYCNAILAWDSHEDSIKDKLVDVTCERCGETYTMSGPFPREYVCFCGNFGIVDLRA